MRIRGDQKNLSRVLIPWSLAYGVEEMCLWISDLMILHITFGSDASILNFQNIYFAWK